VAELGLAWLEQLSSQGQGGDNTTPVRVGETGAGPTQEMEVVGISLCPPGMADLSLHSWAGYPPCLGRAKACQGPLAWAHGHG
jgi:hypothetical protein